MAGDVADLASLGAGAGGGGGGGGVGGFDAVVCTFVVEHLVRPRAAVRSVAHALRPGGWLVLAAPFVEANHGAPHDFHRFTWPAGRGQRRAPG